MGTYPIDKLPESIGVSCAVSWLDWFDATEFVAPLFPLSVARELPPGWS